MKWFKFYGQDWNTDPKIASMSMEDKLCLITLFTIASSEDKEGFIPSLTEESLIYMARIPDWPESDYNPMERASGVIERYKALKIVTEAKRNGTKGIMVSNFKKRQGENLTNAERQKNYRERHKQAKVQPEIYESKHNDSNAGVTTKVTLDKIRLDKNRIPTNNNIDVIESMDGEISNEISSPSPKMKTINFFTGVKDLIDQKESPEIKEFLTEMSAKIPKDVLWREVQKFYSYWTELNGSGKKQRWEMQKTFEVNRRLATWFQKVGEFNKEKKEKFKTVNI